MIFFLQSMSFIENHFSFWFRKKQCNPCLKMKQWMLCQTTLRQTLFSNILPFPCNIFDFISLLWAVMDCNFSKSPWKMRERYFQCSIFAGNLHKKKFTAKSMFRHYHNIFRLAVYQGRKFPRASFTAFSHREIIFTILTRQHSLSSKTKLCIIFMKLECFSFIHVHQLTLCTMFNEALIQLKTCK